MVNQKLLVTAGMVLSLALSSSLWAQGRESVGVTLAARGDVSATDLVSLENRMLRRRSELFNVDRVVTGSDARAQLRMEDDALISLRPGSELVIAEYEFNPETGEGKAIMELVSGGLRTLSGGISPANGRAEYELRTTAGSIGIRGTHYEIVDTDSGVFMGVWDGDIDVQPGNGQPFSLGRNGDYAFASVGDDGQVEFYLDPPEVFSDTGGDSDDQSDSTGDEEQRSEEGDESDEESTEGASEGPDEASEDSKGSDETEESATESPDTSDESPAGSSRELDDLPGPAQNAPGMNIVQQLMENGPPGLPDDRGLGQGGSSGFPGSQQGDDIDVVVNPGQGQSIIPPNSVRTPPPTLPEITATYTLEQIRIMDSANRSYEASMSFQVNFRNGKINEGKLSLSRENEMWTGNFSGGFTGARIEIGDSPGENRMNFATFNDQAATGYLPNSHFYYDKATDAFGEFRFEANHSNHSAGGEWHAARDASTGGAE